MLKSGQLKNIRYFYWTKTLRFGSFVWPQQIPLFKKSPGVSIYLHSHLTSSWWSVTANINEQITHIVIILFHSNMSILYPIINYDLKYSKNYDKYIYSLHNKSGLYCCMALMCLSLGLPQEEFSLV